jgi:hypothetical protein
MPGSTGIFKGRDILRSGIKSLLAPTVLSSGSSSVHSSTFAASGYRTALAYLTVSDTGSTDTSAVQFIAQFATDSAGATGTWFDYLEDMWASMSVSARQLQDSTLKRSHTLPVDGRRLRFAVERSSTEATGASFTASIRLEGID